MSVNGKIESKQAHLDKFLTGFPADPFASNYHNAHKLKAAQCVEQGLEQQAAFHVSESTAACLRTMALYRHEQVHIAAGSTDKYLKISNYLKALEKSDVGTPLEPKDQELYGFVEKGIADMERNVEYRTTVEEPFHRTYMRFTHENNVDNFLKILQEFPEEWTIVQLTSSYNPDESLKSLEVHRTQVDSIYVSLMRNDYTDVLETGPVNVDIPANFTKEGELPLFVELYSLLDENLKIMDNATVIYNKRNVHKYWERRQDVDLRMASVVKVMDDKWIGGWKCLLCGKLQDRQLRDRVLRLVEDTCTDWGFVRFTPTQRVLLCNLISSGSLIPSAEIRSTLQKILLKFPNLDEAVAILKQPNVGCQKCHTAKITDICLKCSAAIFEKVHHFKLADGIKAFMELARQIKNDDDWEQLRTAKRLPVVLIVDETLDTFPWESLPILANQPVTRMENVHMLYSMYKSHETEIQDGYFVIDRQPIVGRYIINPANNLERMGKRMCSFISYWCPEWEGVSNTAPEPEDFIQHLTDIDLLLYCGHGHGGQYLCGVEEAAARGGARAAAVLAGCGSVRLQRGAARTPPLAAHYHYHIANSPLVIGMLWEVSDMEVDKMVSTLLALAVPSRAPVSWQAVGKAQWSQGHLHTNVENKTQSVEIERDFLKAMAKSRRAASYLMIASSIVARGLPVRFGGST